MSDESLIAELEQENRLLRARNDRLERELADLSEAVAKRLEQAGAGMQAGLIREVFIQKSHP
ncbi:MAG: hypothetical protein RL758_126 [Pseudomonadota bacterium]|jgi:cell division protein FtsB